MKKDDPKMGLYFRKEKKMKHENYIKSHDHWICADGTRFVARPSANVGTFSGNTIVKANCNCENGEACLSVYDIMVRLGILKKENKL